MLWFISILESILTIYWFYYAAYKKLYDIDYGLAFWVSGMAFFGAVGTWGLSITMQNIDNMPTDEEPMAIVGPVIIIAIIHFVIILPSYFIYKDNNAK